VTFHESSFLSDVGGAYPSLHDSNRVAEHETVAQAAGSSHAVFGGV
jgi:hypothetical protein